MARPVVDGDGWLPNAESREISGAVAVAVELKPGRPEPDGKIWMLLADALGLACARAI